MNPIWGQIVGVTTVILMLMFIGIWIFAWHRGHRSTFDAMSRLPLQDQEPPP
jgi:cytochrome c oxidase cbb3-type subunit 4